VRHFHISLRLRGQSFSVVAPSHLLGVPRSAFRFHRRPSESLVREMADDPRNAYTLRVLLADSSPAIRVGHNYHTTRNETFRRLSDLLASGRIILIPGLTKASPPISQVFRPHGPRVRQLRRAPGAVPVGFRASAPAPGMSPLPAAPAGISPGVVKMSIEQKMEIAIRGAPLSQEVLHELGDIKTLIASFVVVTGALMALAATGAGAVAEGITIALLLVGAAVSGAQIGRGINSLIDFYRQCERAKNEDDLKKAGVAFADGVAALGIGALFLLLSMLGARARGAGGGGSGAAEEGTEVSGAAKARREPPTRPSAPAGSKPAASAEPVKGTGAKFGDQAKLDDHFQRHGGDFGAKTPAEYQEQADRFLTGSKEPGVLEKARANGDVIRYNPSTDEFGVVSKNGAIRTYYKPAPDVHGHPTNLDYFNAQ
jgi:hypothetical protein